MILKVNVSSCSFQILTQYFGAWCHANHAGSSRRIRGFWWAPW
jgi:hypothetical protein